MKPSLRLLELMRENLGVREEGDNRGTLVDLWNKYNGVPAGSPWCLSMIQYLCNQVVHETGERHKLPKTASVIDLWNKVDPKLKQGPEIGNLVLWQMYSKTGLPTRAGHVGVISQVVSRETIMSIEGNTRGSDPASGIIDREGREVVEQRRNLDKNKGIMRYIGCINPWI